MDAQHLTFSARGLPLAYSVWGDQQKAAEKGVLFCFHGFLDHGHSFATIARALTSELPVIAVDFRGFGHSGWLGDGGYYHFLDNVADAVLLHAALGSPPVHLLAHSMGGSVATAFASARPELVRSLILLEGMGPPREDLDLAPVRLRRWIESLADPVYPIDEGLLADLGKIGEAAGIALGLDRVLMLCLGLDSIQDVVVLPPEDPR